MSAYSNSSVVTPVDRFLYGESGLDTPVARLAGQHETNREKIALSKPLPGQQFAFEVDFDRCTGCKACVTACHSMNGLDDDEIWRDVGFIQGGNPEQPYLQTVTTACHHCIEPGCLQGCPVNAYEKDPVTGIVLHLDDQCIGCQYCVLKCPYDVPKYNERLGIVRKCDMCHGRLEAGEAPACVQACPNEAIRIVTVDTATVVEELNAEETSTKLLPGVVDSDYTVPTTRYVTRKAIPNNARAADEGAPQLQPTHGPLVGMLVLTQASLGVLFAAMYAQGTTAVLAWGLSVVLCLAGLGSSVLHLGKPLKAWRAFLGLRHSWLSREIVIFGAYFPLLVGSGLFFMEAPWFPWLEISQGMVLAALIIGLAGVGSSVMIYHDTRRPYWHAKRGAMAFLGTVMVCFAATLLLITTLQGSSTLGATILLAVVVLIKLIWEAGLYFPLPWSFGQVQPEARKLRRRQGSGYARLRWTCGLSGGLVLPGLAFFSPDVMVATWVWVGLAWIALLLGESVERIGFFRFVVPYKMPGGINP